MNPKPVGASEMRTEAIVGNAIAVVATALMPGTMLVLPVLCAVTLPYVVLAVLLFFVADWPGCVLGVTRLGMIGLRMLGPAVI